MKETLPLTRRAFLRGAVLLAAAPPVLHLAGCSDEAPPARPNDIDGWPVPSGTTLSPERYAQLSALFDALVPASDGFAGAIGTHAAWYLDQLLGAFRHDPPRIYAGGPYSGRHGGLDGFSQFQPLTRVEELRWRTYIEGSQGRPEREWNGPVKGLAQIYDEGLAALEPRARERFDSAFTALDIEQRRVLLSTMDAQFRDIAYVHACEGTYADPVYGGNFEQRGWASIQYEGDRQPLGYTSRQMTHPEEG